MHDVVVLYSGVLYHTARDTVEWLEHRGLAVWWDHKEERGQWARNVEKALRNTRCAVFIWPSSNEISGSELTNEVQYAKRRSIVCFHFATDMSDPPLEIAGEVTAELSSKGHEENLSRVLRWLSSNYSMQIPSSIDAKEGNQKTMEYPEFARSVSSHETQLPPLSALLALTLHPATSPILISAFDWYHLIKEQKDQARQYIRWLKSRGVTVMLDSGNYEASRIRAWYAQLGRKAQPGTNWDEERFCKATSDCSFADIIFTYDDPSFEGSLRDCIRHIEAEYEATKRNCRPDQLVVPIVHAPYDDGGSRQTDLLPEIICGVMEASQCSYVAVPERELGDGILTRCRTVQDIKSKMKEGTSQPRLHLLGTGNPVSLSMLAAFGADSFDGLEWLRVVTNPMQATLHHFQHFDLFHEHMKFSEFDIVRDVAIDGEYSYALKAAVHNLDFMHMWMHEIECSLSDGSVEQLLAAFGHSEAAASVADALIHRPGR